MENEALLPHYFRTEYRKIVAVLCRRFGFHHMETAEDIASETFLTAAQSWGVQGMPQNPTAWLYRVAANKAINHLQRESTFIDKIVPVLSNDVTRFEHEIDLSVQNIRDSQLAMMFAICHPVIPVEAQIGLSLRILCGFGIEEIADAFLTTKETINKRLFRAREKLREAKITLDLPDTAALATRLAPVLTTIYLLFNEGYYSISQNTTLRKDLCLEAMRLCRMLVENESTDQPPVNALLALMCFHASRFDARLHTDGEIILYAAQDTSLWNQELISQGGYFLQRATTGNTVSRYHLEAGIAYWNTQKEDTAEKWAHVLHLYNRLLQLEYSPVAALNRTYALSKAKGKKVAIAAAEKLDLPDHHFYWALLGELYKEIDNSRSRQYFQQAWTLAKTMADKTAIQKEIDRL